MLMIKQFFIALVLFVVFDIIWLVFVMKKFNMAQLADIGRIENGVFQMNYAAAIVTYILMALAVAYYILPQLSKHDSLLKVFLSGALLGLVTVVTAKLTAWNNE